MKLHTLTTVDHTGLYKLYLVSLLTQFQFVVYRIMQITCSILKEAIIPIIALYSYITNKSLI